ncbi:MAG: hypothetical protein DMF56_26275 [Acidobacteria bacterium]|nr:MAG: hypothetical protein DMF56_26275 [Acidobacteriota bacterium]
MVQKADVLIVTVTPVESRAVIEVFKEATGKEAKPESIADGHYLDLGEVNGTRVFMALSGMGSGGTGGSQELVRKGIEALSPSAVIMVGIAFGIDDKKHAIGDVLVAHRIMLYDLQRRGTDKAGNLKVVARGDRPSSSPRLFNWLRMASLAWDSSKGRVDFGLFLCGDHLIDNKKYRAQLLKLEAEAIGGEMEGGGLYAACQNGKVDWILVKAISDWADGKKDADRDARQQKAARNAAAFVLHALQQAPLKGEETGEEQKPVPSSLPPQPYFFGREKELAFIQDAISPEARTWGALIDGPGGIGKTALAVRAGQLATGFDRKIFLSAKVRELTASGEQKLEDFMLPNYTSLLTELGRELGEEDIGKIDPSVRANKVRRALANVQALIIIDNVETFEEPERVRLYQFLSRLPTSSKAIVTSRRRADIDARVVRLDRLERKDALALMNELAINNRVLRQASDKECNDLYEITNGNPLLIKWAVAQLGRAASQCRTIADACAFLASAPRDNDNDPLEYIFGDLLETFSESETAVLSALVHFTQPAPVKWVADVAGIAERAAITALEDLTDRALLVSTESVQEFLLPSLAATFLRRKRPQVVSQTGGRLTDQVYALVLENGFRNYERFPTLERAWPAIAAALPLVIQGINERLQKLCDALRSFLEFSGRLDESLFLFQQAEEKALANKDLYNAGWRAYHAGAVYFERKRADEAMACAIRCATHWEKAPGITREKAVAIRLRGQAYQLKKDFSSAIAANQEALDLWRAIAPESSDVAMALNSLAAVNHKRGHHAAAGRDYREALRIAKATKYREGIAIYTGNLSVLALDCEEWTTAEDYARQALALNEELGNSQLIGLNCARIARALTKQGNGQEALSYAQRAVEILSKLAIPDSLAYAYATLKECGG